MSKFRPIPELEGKHFDIGIFGMWFGENYGSTLTYYALRKTLIDLGYSVLMLDKPRLDSQSDQEFDPNIHPRVFAREEGYDISPCLAHQEFRAFNQYCGTFIVGSDQVWNYNIARYFRSLSYLSFVSENNKRISYASSYGHSSSLTPKDARSDVAKHLHKFDAISVREASGVDISRNEFGVHATQVVDPIYLQDKSVYESVMRRPADDMLPTGDYLLCYVLDPNKKIAAVIREAAQSLKLTPVVMLDGRGNLEKAKELMGIDAAFRCPDARQWLYYISHAKHMITDSFHGASFALLFHVQVAIIGNSRGKARITSLIDTFQLPPLLAHDAESLRAIINGPNRIDFERFDAILSMEKARSLRWLKQALETPHAKEQTIRCITHKECCGCAACYSACPVGAIAMLPDEEGFLYPAVEESTCISCGKCKKACPSINPRLEKEHKPLVFAAYGHDEVREISSSGGLFTLVARKTLERGGLVFGAAFDDEFTLTQISASDEAELEPLRMSKYMQSHTGESFKEAKEALDEGRQVLYVGCPCHIAGLNSFLGKRYPNLFTMDLLCHGGPSQKVFKKYLDEVHGGRKISYVGFRDKDYFGWSTEMTVKYSDGEIYRKKRNEDLFYRSFLPCLSVRPHCQICNYARLPRQGDLTLGDFWGVAKLDERFTDGKGTSIVSVNSPRGLNMLRSLWRELDLLETVPREYVLTHGQPYNNPFKNDPRRTRFHRMIRDTSIRTAVVNCESGVFDFAVLNANGDTPADLLRSYAIYKTLARADHSVLIVQRPQEIDPTPYSGRYAFTSFMNNTVPALSSHKTLEKQQALKHYCRAFISDKESQRAFPETSIGTKPVLTFEEYAKGWSISPLMLLNRDDLAALLGGDTLAIRSIKRVFISLNSPDTPNTPLREAIGKSGIAYLETCDTESLESWMTQLIESDCVVTDDLDTAYVAACFEIPTAFACPSGLSETTRRTLTVLGLSPIESSADISSFLKSPIPGSIDASAWESFARSVGDSFVEIAESTLSDPIARVEEAPEIADAEKPMKRHSTLYRTISKRVPRKYKRKIKRIVKVLRN